MDIAGVSLSLGVGVRRRDGHGDGAGAGGVSVACAVRGFQLRRGAGFRGAGGGSVCGGCVAAGRDVWWAALACWGCLTVTRVCASLSRC